jgi:hypothetical protein
VFIEEEDLNNMEPEKKESEGMDVCEHWFDEVLANLNWNFSKANFRDIVSQHFSFVRFLYPSAADYCMSCGLKGLPCQVVLREWADQLKINANVSDPNYASLGIMMRSICIQAQESEGMCSFLLYYSRSSSSSWQLQQLPQQE